MGDTVVVARSTFCLSVSMLQDSAVLYETDAGIPSRQKRLGECLFIDDSGFGPQLFPYVTTPGARAIQCVRFE